MARMPSARKAPVSRATGGRPAADGGPRLTREQKKERTRALLIDAGATLILERGLLASSLDSIAEAAGLTKGAIYSNFGSKADFFFELVTRLFDEPITTADASQPQLAASDFLAHLRAHPEYWARMLEFASYMNEDPDLRRAVVRGRFPDGVEPLAGPDDERWRSVAMEAAAGGIAVLRLLYGEEFLPDDLALWMFARLGE